jgi:hypothetical protein
MNPSFLFRARTPRVLLAAAALAAASVTAAAAQNDRAALLLSDRPAPRRSCEVEMRPRALPTISQLADSAALMEAVTRFAEQFRLREGTLFALYSLVFDRDGNVERLAPLEYRMPQGHAESFAALVRQHIRRQERGGFSVRLRVEPTGNPAFLVGRSERCPPEPTTSFELTAPAMAGPVSRPSPIRLRVWVTPEGTPGTINVMGSSGSSELDRWVRDSLARRRFRPGLLDGVPVAMEYEGTVRIRTR